MTIEKLFKIKTDEDLAKLGFECQGMLLDQEGFKNFYERLWVWNNARLQIDIITYDQGNGWCDVMTIKQYNDEWPKPMNIIRRQFKNGLYLLLESFSDEEWDFNLWQPDEKNPKDYGVLYSGGTIKKAEYPEIEDAYVWVKNAYDK